MYSTFQRLADECEDLIDRVDELVARLGDLAVNIPAADEPLARLRALTVVQYRLLITVLHELDCGPAPAA